MYKQTKDTYTLNARDKLVITYEDGKIRVLINNHITLYPTSLSLNTGTYEYQSISEDKKNIIVNSLAIECTSEE